MEQELQKPTYTKLWARKMRNVFRGLDHEKMGTCVLIVNGLRRDYHLLCAI